MKSFQFTFWTFLLSMQMLFINTVRCQEVKVVKIDELISQIENNRDTILVINFWATWCKPCVKELSCFYELNRETQKYPVRILLVSLDFKRNLNNTLIPFLKKRGIGPETWLLDETDYDSWINRVETSWSGSIPATLFIDNRRGIRKFHEGEFECKSLNEIVFNLLNP